MVALRMKRTRALAVLIVAVLSLSAIPSMVFDGDAVPAVSAAAEEYDVKVGWLSDIINWNPMYIAMVEDYIACFLMYSSLFSYDEDYAVPVPDLVLTHNISYHQDGSMTIWLDLTRNAYFRNNENPSDTSRPLDAYDVSYTFWAACSRTDTMWEYYLRDYACSVVDDYTVRLDVPYTKAAAIDDITGVPIVSEGFYNGSIALNANMDPDECYGTGPFVFDDMLSSSWWKFGKAEHYHGEADYGEERMVKITNITYVMVANSGSLAIEMNAGKLDVAVLTGEPDVYLGEFTPTEENKLVMYSTSEPGICDIAINAVPLVLRNGPSEPGKDYCDGNLHLLDREVRKAILLTMNKTLIRESVMKDLSVIAQSVIMPGVWQADLEGVLPYDIQEARDTLEAAGYIEDTDGIYYAGPTSDFILNEYDKDPYNKNPRLEGIRCHAPDTDPSWGDITTVWTATALQAGISFDAETLSETTMINEEWYNCMYDIWVWHWGWGPEPLSDLSVWVTNEILTGGDNCQMPMGEWWVHSGNYSTSPFVNASMIEEFDMTSDTFIGFSSFDQNFSLAVRTPDFYERREIVWDLQQMVYDSYTESPPYYDVGLYVVSELRYQCWGNWEDDIGLTVTMGPPWLWFQLLPADNLVPTIVSGLSSYDVDIGEDAPFSITVNDPTDDKLWVNWSFGDGTYDNQEINPTGNEIVATSHIYSTSGTYALTVTVTDGYMYHTQTDEAEVHVMAEADAYPQLYGLTFTPPTAYIGEVTTWGVTVQDAEASSMTLTFAWGDGAYTVRTLTPDPVGTAMVVSGVTHTYTAEDDYSVVISLWDGQPYETHNVSLTRTYSVIANVAPDSPVISTVTTNEDVWVPVSATTSDDDPDILTVTWDWGGGEYNVTTHDTTENPGAAVISTAWHMWDAPGTYDFIVYVDDQENHNVSTPGSVTVNPAGTNTGPTSITLLQSPDPGIVDETITLTLGAFDANADPLEFYVEFGDGDAGTASSEGGAGIQTVTLDHVYTEVDEYTVTVYVDDGGGDASSNVSATFTVSVEAPPENIVPEIMLLTGYSAMYNETFVITPAFVYDEDAADELSVWYDWGDGTAVTEGDPAANYNGTHVYSEIGMLYLTAYVDDNSGLEGHNVSVNTVVEVNYNRRPDTKSLTMSPETGPYYTGDTITFTVVVSDDEGDDLTIVIDFGDGSDLESATRLDPGEKVNLSLEFTHVFESADTCTVKVWTEDEFDHPVADWIALDIEIEIVEEEVPPTETNWALIAGIIALVVVVVVAVAALLMKKRKGKSEGDAGENAGGMEGMAPP